ncbi:hypothetical protein [Aquimarina sp. 2304DJ70-9]|uniref:hypothetical protein n=1 Tax=Aquimarina penaris TaxID=3231044 RepID=UPI00346185F6
MKNKILSLPLFLLAGLLVMLSSCDSDSDTVQNPVPTSPVLLDEFFFTGTLGDDAFDIRFQSYDATIGNPPNDDHTIDFGGGGINRVPRTGEDIEYCYGSYAFGVLPDNTQSPVPNVDGAKLFIYEIALGQCSTANENETLESFFNRDSFVYSEGVSDRTLSRITFSLFPPEVAGVPAEEQDFYTSAGENTNATFAITSVEEEDENTYILEGTFACTMYSHLDDTNSKALTNGKFRIKVKTN